MSGNSSDLRPVWVDPDDAPEFTEAMFDRAEFAIGDRVVRPSAQTEAARYFAARAARVVPGQAEEILARAGRGNPPRDDDRLS